MKEFGYSTIRKHARRCLETAHWRISTSRIAAGCAIKFLFKRVNSIIKRRRIYILNSLFLPRIDQSPGTVEHLPRLIRIASVQADLPEE